MLEDFTKEFSGKFGKVFDSIQAYEEFSIVGETEMPTFTGKVKFGAPERIFHESLGTSIYETREEAESELIEKIIEHTKSKVSEDDYKRYTLLWRVRPQIDHKIDPFENKHMYRGYARLIIWE